MIWILLICFLLMAAVITSYLPRIPAVLPAYAGMLVLYFSGFASFMLGADALWFWGIASVLVLGLDYMLPREVTRSSAGVPFIVTGAIAGMAVGIALSTVASVIIATAAGAFFGAIAYANTRAGREIMTFPSRQFFNWFAAKALRAIVTLSITGISLACLLFPSSL